MVSARSIFNFENDSFISKTLRDLFRRVSRPHREVKALQEIGFSGIGGARDDVQAWAKNESAGFLPVPKILKERNWKPVLAIDLPLPKHCPQ